MAKTAVVTGGTGALGAAVAEAFSRAGYHVQVSSSGDPARYSGPGKATRVDLRDLAATRAWLGTLGPVHAAALCAGGFAMQGIAEMTPEVYDTQLDLNLRTAAYTLSALAPVLAEPAAVVLVGSQAYGGAAGKAIYAAAKAGVVSLTRSAAEELRERGVRVNAVLPDIIDTPANRSAMPNASFDTWAKPEEIAEVITFLCSDSARVVSGNVLDVGR